MAKGKHIDDISMSFTDPPTPDTSAAPTVAAEDVEELKENGQLVYRKNKKTGDIKFFVQEDGKDKEVDIDVIDKLEKAYPTIPDRSYQGFPKKGETTVRFVKEQTGFNEETRKMETKTIEVPYDECELISERQEYENGEIVTNTIVKKHHNLVKLLRGEIGG